MTKKPQNPANGGWPADRVKMMAPSALLVNARNPRTHPEGQIAQIASAIQEWGWTTPILIDEHNEIIAGHGRHEAAKQLGLKAVPTVMATGWTEDQKRAYLVADNKLAMNAQWDVSMLASIIDDLTIADFDISLLGFSEDDLTRMQTDLDRMALSNLAGDAPPTPEQKEDNPLPNGSVAFSLVMATEARRVLHEAIIIMKTRQGYETSAEALVAICREWMENQDEN